MPYVDSTIVPEDDRLREWWYNALDCCVTGEIYDITGASELNRNTYEFERSLQGLALDMMLGGFRIDPVWRMNAIRTLETRETRITAALNLAAEAVWGTGLNPNSPKQLIDFFYDALGLPTQYIFQKGVRKISTNREALEKLQVYWIAQPFINCIFILRDTRKKLSTLRTGVDPDGFLEKPGQYMRSTYNVCGTETGRWASSGNVWGRGGNMQNVTDELRRPMIADPGTFLLYMDGEQAESRAVGFIHGEIFDDWTYLDACEDGDLHTAVTKLTWTTLNWTGDKKLDRKIADTPFYRWFTYRDMAKRGGHGTNYYGKPPQMSKHLKVPEEIIVQFQERYFDAFPAMRRWHHWVAEQLGTKQSLTTFVGRERTFFGRADDDATLRKAIAYEPQSAVGDIINEGGKRVWRKYRRYGVLPRAQVHDAFIFQVPGHPDNNHDLIMDMKQTFQVPIRSKRNPDRVMIIPSEAKVGWNWASTDPEHKTFFDGNPDGLDKWKGPNGRQRQDDPLASLLDRVVC